jgi:glutamate N-acetyltransferase/amino-acid N-acetyltransferase
MSKVKGLTDFDGVFGQGIHAGIKPEKKDLAFIYVKDAVASAGCFTLSHFAAPCIGYTKKLLKTNVLKAVVINSGNANAATGKQGLDDSKEMGTLLAERLGLRRGEVGVASTGIIAKPLPMDVVKAGINTLDLTAKDTPSIADAILTTDLFTKVSTRSTKIGKKEITVSGVAKGSGMIAPNMGTMLAYIVTDATFSNTELQELLQRSVTNSFNMVSVDGDTSTNDMVLAFATGQRKFTTTDASHMKAFQELLTDVCIDLTKMIAKDGEGATRVIECHVRGAMSKTEARKIAINVVSSPLVKTAIHGADPNWGRVVAAASKDPQLKVSPKKMSLSFNGMAILKEGEVLVSDRSLLKPLMEKDEIVIDLDINLGNAYATAWGCDLSHGYIDINTTYS